MPDFYPSKSESNDSEHQEIDTERSQSFKKNRIEIRDRPWKQICKSSTSKIIFHIVKHIRKRDKKPFIECNEPKQLVRMEIHLSYAICCDLPKMRINHQTSDKKNAEPNERLGIS